MTLTRRLQLLSAFAFFVSLWLLGGAVDASGLDTATVLAFTGCFVSTALVLGLEWRARREDEIARMNRSPQPIC